MRIAICDDQLSQLALLEKQCHKWATHSHEVIQIQTFPSAESFLFAYETDKKWDILLLDIQMPGLTGMELAKKLRTEQDSLTIALITAISDYALEGYQIDALAYLLKPVSDSSLFKLLDKVRSSTPDPFLLAESESQVLRIALSKILYLESQGHNTRIVCTDSETISPRSLSYYENQLSALTGPCCFHRIHRCYLVNLAHTASIHRKEVILDTDEQLPVARGRFEPLTLAYLAYYRQSD